MLILISLDNLFNYQLRTILFCVEDIIIFEHLFKIRLTI